MKMRWNMKDLVGMRFDRLLVISPLDERTKGQKRLWLCLCDCGKTSKVTTDHLNSGHSKSCGCLIADTMGVTMRTHGLSGDRSSEYKAWSEMKARCGNPNNTSYPNYGGRGIHVCDRWLDSYPNFLEDMGPKPHPSLSLDRVKVNEGYSPENCKWSTRLEQSRNRRNVPVYPFDGMQMTLPEWAEKTGINRDALYQRIYKLGWPLEKALTTEVKERKEIECC